MLKNNEKCVKQIGEPKSVKMYKKILEKVASVGTVALLGYEIGSHTVEGEKAEKVNHEDHSTNIIIFGIIVFIIMLMAIIARLALKRRRLV